MEQLLEDGEFDQSPQSFPLKPTSNSGFNVVDHFTVKKYQPPMGTIHGELQVPTCSSPSTPQSDDSGGSLSSCATIHRDLPMNCALLQPPAEEPTTASVRPTPSSLYSLYGRVSPQPHQPTFGSSNHAGSSSHYVSPFLSVEGRPLPVPAHSSLNSRPVQSVVPSNFQLANMQMLVSTNHQLAYNTRNVPLEQPAVNFNAELMTNSMDPPPPPPSSLFACLPPSVHCGMPSLSNMMPSHFPTSVPPSVPSWNCGPALSPFDGPCPSMNFNMNEASHPFSAAPGLPLHDENSMWFYPPSNSCLQPQSGWVQPPTPTQLEPRQEVAPARKSKSLLPGGGATQPRPMLPLNRRNSGAGTAGTEESVEKVCAICEKPATLECSSCARMHERGFPVPRTFFCCSDHQRLAWKEHNASVHLKFKC